MKRVLVTGSRDWEDTDAIESGLRAAIILFGEDGVTLVHGACPSGADWQADHWWMTNTEFPMERYPADWETHGKRAGFIRNSQMVSLGADLCLAFIKNESKGASMTARLAEEANIPTIRIIQ